MFLTFSRIAFPGPTALRASALAFGCLALPSFAQAADEDYEDSTARFQATYIRQNKPAFNAAYSGQNSLSANWERSYTATVTAYLGFRPWRGGELYLNPEVTQGVPFSGLEGSAGFTNGELTRTAGTTPTLYRQRLFLRQTTRNPAADDHS